MNLKFWEWGISKTKHDITIKLNKGYEFPCKGCIVLPGRCNQLCDKVVMEDDEVREAGEKATKNQEHLTCLDCGGQEWYDGPSGGMSQNIKCGRCGHWFNFGGPFGFTERIHVGENKRVYN